MGPSVLQPCIFLVRFLTWHHLSELCVDPRVQGRGRHHDGAVEARRALDGCCQINRRHLEDKRHTVSPSLKNKCSEEKAEILLVAVRREEMKPNHRNEVSLHVHPVRIANMFYFLHTDTIGSERSEGALILQRTVKNTSPSNTPTAPTHTHTS